MAGDIQLARIEALRAAVAITRPGSHPDVVIAVADRLEAWLLEPPAHLVLTPSPLTFTQGAPGPGVPTRHHHQGVNMAVTLTDNQQVTYTVEAEDSKGFEVSDTLAWSEDSAGAVITLTVAADGLSALAAAVAPGSATVTVTDGTLSGSDLVTVTTGEVAQIILTPGAPEDEPAA
jgi:hypothetical protein